MPRRNRPHRRRTVRHEWYFSEGLHTSRRIAADLIAMQVARGVLEARPNPEGQPDPDAVRGVRIAYYAPGSITALVSTAERHPVRVTVLAGRWACSRCGEWAGPKCAHAKAVHGSQELAEARDRRKGRAAS